MVLLEYDKCWGISCTMLHQVNDLAQAVSNIFNLLVVLQHYLHQEMVLLEYNKCWGVSCTMLHQVDGLAKAVSNIFSLLCSSTTLPSLRNGAPGILQVLRYFLYNAPTSE